MTDVEAVLRAYLAGQAGIAALAGNRIYAAVDPPAGYTPDDGAAIVLGIRGGGQAYHSKTLIASVQMRCFGATATAARALDRALYGALNDKQAAGIPWARLDVLGTLLMDPETGWQYVLSYWTVMVSN